MLALLTDMRVSSSCSVCYCDDMKGDEAHMTPDAYTVPLVFVRLFVSQQCLLKFVVAGYGCAAICWCLCVAQYCNGLEASAVPHGNVEAQADYLRWQALPAASYSRSLLHTKTAARQPLFLHCNLISHSQQTPRHWIFSATRHRKCSALCAYSSTAG